MILGQVPTPRLTEALATSGLALNTGAFRTRLKSDVPDLAEEIATLYADYPVELEDSICDFFVEVVPSSGLRKMIRPQVLAYIERSKPFEPMPQNLAFPMFESTLNWCIATRSYRHLLIHAAVIARNGRAIVLAAPSGSGKSTLSAFMALEGWQLLSDEFAILRLCDGRLLPNPRPISLKNESIGRVRSYGDQAWVSREFEGTAKGTIAFLRPPGILAINDEDAAVPAIVAFPSYEAHAPLELVPVGKSEAFMELLDNAVNYLVHRRRGFEAVSRLVEQCEFYRLRYGNTSEAISSLTRLLEDTRPLPATGPS